jgi:coatomer subunit beta'
MLASLFNGNVHVWNHETQTLVKSFEVTEVPVRAARFVVRKSWVVTGSDDMQVRVFNYNTLEKVTNFEAHADYIRCIIVHPSQPYVLTSSDDMLIKLWDWDKKWECIQVFEGHSHYVMMIALNPKDNNQFASASLDRTIKVWSLGSNHPNFTLEGHEKGVNCVGYFQGGDKPYLISGADDRLAKVWDYQNKACVQTLEGHAHNVVATAFHPELPVILTGSEDGTVRLWHSSTYRLESTLNYGMERVWCFATMKGMNDVAIGYDEGSAVIKLGREEPAMSMDNSGKIIWSKHSEMQQANLKGLADVDVKDGERLPLAIKDMGSCEVFPNTISHSPNGRFVVVCGDGEYIIYTAMALRNKSFGSGQEFVWAGEGNEYAVRENSSTVKLFKNFKEIKSFKPDIGAEGIFGGSLLGIRSSNRLSFYDFESLELIRRIEISAKLVFWADSGLVAVVTEESYFILKYNAEEASHCLATNEGIDEDGIDSAFDVVGEVEESVRAGCWIGDCFIYTNSLNRLNYYVGGEIVTISHLDRPMYLLGYIPAHNRLYLGDRELSVVGFSLQVSVLEYQTAIMRQDFEMADQILPRIPQDQRARVAHFLEKQGFKKQALAVSTDPDHRFDLAIQLKELRIAYQIAQETDSEEKWKVLGDLALNRFEFGLAKECLYKAKDFGALLLLATSSGDVAMTERLAEEAKKTGDTNIAFSCLLLSGHLPECLEMLISTNRLPEAAFFARTYLPSEVTRVVNLWKEDVAKSNQKIADALADPENYENLFQDFKLTLQAEKYAKDNLTELKAASLYPSLKDKPEQTLLEVLSEMGEDLNLDQPQTTTEAVQQDIVEDLLDFDDIQVDDEEGFDDDIDLEDKDLLGD